jgi:hypothetical protein
MMLLYICGALSQQQQRDCRDNKRIRREFHLPVEHHRTCLNYLTVSVVLCLVWCL